MSVSLSRVALSLASANKSPRQKASARSREEGEKSSGERISLVFERVREVGGEREKGGEKEKDKASGETERKEEKKGGERVRDTCVVS